MKVLELVLELERVFLVKNLDFENFILEWVFGVCWDVVSDKFGFYILVKDKWLMWRGILFIISLIYDLLGFVVFFILFVKVIL